MKVIKYLDVEPTQETPGVAKREVITADDGAPNFCMRVFDVRSGMSTPSHSHEWEHEIFILCGQGMIVTEQGATQIGKENVIFIAPNEIHCIVNTSNEPLRFICVIPLHQ
ncbi:MAG: cupin domain-containing protein [Dehalococcoidales bacterium]|nr:cupin domain-containing protein [Dehalococcoidales bacterium]